MPIGLKILREVEKEEASYGGLQQLQLQQGEDRALASPPPHTVPTEMKPYSGGISAGYKIYNKTSIGEHFMLKVNSYFLARPSALPMADKDRLVFGRVLRIVQHIGPDNKQRLIIQVGC